MSQARESLARHRPTELSVSIAVALLACVVTASCVLVSSLDNLGPPDAQAPADSGSPKEAQTHADSGSSNIAYVQGVGNEYFLVDGGVPAFSGTLPKPVTAGDILVVAVAQGEADHIQVTDNAANKYLLAAQWTSCCVQIWYATVEHVPAGRTTVTATFNRATAGTFYAHEYIGLNRTSPLDRTSSESGDGQAIETCVITTTAPELLFGFASVQWRVKDAGIGFTPRFTAGGNMSEDEVVGAEGHHCATFTEDIPGTWVALMAAFKGAP
jgi:hypothetical protein